MADQVAYRASLLSVLGGIAGAAFLIVASFFTAMSMTEDELLHSHARGSGLFVALESVIGMTGIHAIFFVFGVVSVWYGLINLWRLFDRRPDALATADRIAFHPSTRSGALRYADVTRWSYKPAGRRMILQIHTAEKYWGLAGILPRKSVHILGSGRALDDLAQFLARQPEMARKRD